MLVATGLAAAAAFALCWLLSLWRGDVTIVDAWWGPGFALLAWTAWWRVATAPAPASLLLPLLATAWGARLGGYLLWRHRGQPEDKRYAALRARFQPFWLHSAWLVFGLQAALQWTIALPLVTVQLAPPRLDALVLPGLALFALGLGFETVADLQLARFKADPANRGRVLDRGLWRTTRHPNYFGDFLVWWGLGATALAQGAPWWTLVSPALMSWLLLRVSGVPLLEEGLTRSRPGYAEYVRRTPAFFPGRPRPPASAPPG